MCTLIFVFKECVQMLHRNYVNVKKRNEEEVLTLNVYPIFYNTFLMFNYNFLWKSSFISICWTKRKIPVRDATLETHLLSVDSQGVIECSLCFEDNFPAVFSYRLFWWYYAFHCFVRGFDILFKTHSNDLTFKKFNYYIHNCRISDVDFGLNLYSRS